MTLVELLVVVAIIGVLAVTVLPNVAGVAESRRSREAVRTVSSFIAKAQSRAVGRREWSGLMMATVSTSTTSFVATDLYLADVPPVYRGETIPALLAVTGSVSATVRTATGNTGTINTAANINANDLVRFDGRGPWYEITAVSATSLSFRCRGNSSGASEDVGNEPRNTPWPPLSAPLVGSGTNRLAFEILRQPVPSGSPVSLGDGRVIDVVWCGCGPPTITVGGLTLASYRPFVSSSASWTAAGGASTFILFDGTGRLRQVVVRSGGTVFRQAVTGPVFLLIGRADRASQSYAALSSSDDTVGANWQYQDSFWVAIDPATGVVKTAECTPGATTVVESQAWIRQSLLAEGR